MVASSLRDLTEGRWQPVIDDEERRAKARDVRRLVMCTGKVYVDLVSSPQRAESSGVAIVRVEQLYPFPTEDLAGVVKGYPNLQEVVWLQEEPQNMGYWDFAAPIIAEILGGRVPLRYVGRPRSASPSEGSSAWHAINQRLIVEQAFQGAAQPEAVRS
jgi:2-oxoglutarate dehydrogenase E1 component